MQTNQAIDWQGHMLGHYQMLRLIGRGALGEVWLAQDTQRQRQVAIKLLPAVLASDEGYLSTFTHEAQVAATLKHPHILPLRDFGKQPLPNGEVITFLVMPYVTDSSLQDRTNKH